MAAAYYGTPVGIHFAKTDAPMLPGGFRDLRDLMGDDPLLLDIGCGLGRARDAIRAIGVNRYIGVDASEAMIAIARERYPSDDFRVGSFYELGRTVPERCDVFFALHSLSHVPRGHMKRALASIRGVLREGAIGLIAVPEGEAFVLRDADYFHSDAPDELERLPPETAVIASAWSQRMLRPDLERTGFVVLPERTRTSATYLDLVVQAV
jgi:SAM-dependent methyltransferase